MAWHPWLDTLSNVFTWTLNLHFLAKGLSGGELGRISEKRQSGKQFEASGQVNKEMAPFMWRKGVTIGDSCGAFYYEGPKMTGGFQSVIRFYTRKPPLCVLPGNKQAAKELLHGKSNVSSFP